MILYVIFHHLYFAMKQRIAFSRRGFKNRVLYFRQNNSDIVLGVNTLFKKPFFQTAIQK